MSKLTILILTSCLVQVHSAETLAYHSIPDQWIKIKAHNELLKEKCEQNVPDNNKLYAKREVHYAKIHECVNRLSKGTTRKDANIEFQTAFPNIEHRTDFNALNNDQLLDTMLRDLSSKIRQMQALIDYRTAKPDDTHFMQLERGGSNNEIWTKLSDILITPGYLDIIQEIRAQSNGQESYLQIAHRSSEFLQLHSKLLECRDSALQFQSTNESSYVKFKISKYLIPNDTDEERVKNQLLDLKEMFNAIKEILEITESLLTADAKINHLERLAQTHSLVEEYGNRLRLTALNVHTGATKQIFEANDAQKSKLHKLMQDYIPIAKSNLTSDGMNWNKRPVLQNDLAMMLYHLEIHVGKEVQNISKPIQIDVEKKTNFFKELTMDLILIGNVLEANRYFNKFTYLLYIRQLAMKRALANLIQSCLNSFKKNGEHTAFIEIEKHVKEVLERVNLNKIEFKRLLELSIANLESLKIGGNRRQGDTSILPEIIQLNLLSYLGLTKFFILFPEFHDRFRGLMKIQVRDIFGYLGILIPTSFNSIIENFVEPKFLQASQPDPIPQYTPYGISQRKKPTPSVYSLPESIADGEVDKVPSNAYQTQPQAAPQQIGQNVNAYPHQGPYSAPIPQTAPLMITQTLPYTAPVPSSIQPQIPPTYYPPPSNSYSAPPFPPPKPSESPRTVTFAPLPQADQPPPQQISSPPDYQRTTAMQIQPAQSPPHNFGTQLNRTPSPDVHFEAGSTNYNYATSAPAYQPHYTTSTHVDPSATVSGYGTTPMVKKTTTVHYVRYEPLDSYQKKASAQPGAVAGNNGRGTTINVDTNNRISESPSLRVSIQDH